MSFYEWRPYVPVAARRQQAERTLAKLRKRGQSIAPVTIEGSKIAKSFWGKSWCTNLERYSDYASRLPRGRTYVRNGSVVDLQIAAGKIAAMVAGSELYNVKIAIAPVTPKDWKAICRDCAGTVDSLVELLQGRLAESVMDRVCRAGNGLFPSPREIKLSCSCPDWAGMCKHVAAALYGVGARLDEMPQLLFVLRDVDENELLASAGQGLPLASAAPNGAAVLDEGDVAALFGLEMADASAAEPVVPPARKRSPRSKAPAGSPARSKPVAEDAKPTAKVDRSRHAARAKPEPERPRRRTQRPAQHSP